ncbi:MAG: glycosyltransferase family 39 protein [Pseudomonadales bacterium]|nr:glycosyltransferase family 39 protein [Pseudomonadales bacterium]
MNTLLKKYPLLIFIIFIALFLRIYKISNPILDWHSWRQADTASVTREYVKSEINPLYPKYHDISNIASGLENPEGYRMVEFPIYNIIVAFILKSFSTLQLEATSRMVSIIFSIGTLVSLFFLTKSYYGKKAAYLASFFFAVLPYSVFYSRTILPEPTMLFFSTFSLVTLRYYLIKPSYRHYLLSVISLAIAVLLKPFVIFLFPLYIQMILEKKGWKGLKDFRLYLYALISIIPFLLWRKWIINFPAGIPASDWLFNGNGIRFRPAWFRWLGYERITKLILGFVGIIFLPISFLGSLKEKEFFIPSWWLGIGIYFSVIATGNIQHDYYQILITPIISITLAHGVLILDKFLSKKINALVSMGLISFLIILTLYFSNEQVKGYFNINHPELYDAGIAADRLLPKDAIVIAPYFGDTAFLFQTNRWGWPIGDQIDDKISKGATHYVTTNMNDEAKQLEAKYIIVEKTQEYMILDLRQERELEL